MTGAFRRIRTFDDPPARPGRLERHQAKIERDGKFVSKAGKVRKRLGRPGAQAD